METHAVVCPAVLASLQSNPPPGYLIKTIAERYAQEFAFYRRYIAEQEILMPLGLTADEFLTRQNEMSHEFVRDVAAKLLNHRVESEAIIAGVDHTGAHIFKILDPGVAKSFDTPCFASIGAGSPHAESHLMTIGFNKNLSLSQAMYAVFAAKSKAEIAAGVGTKTDLTVIRGTMIDPPERGGTFPAQPHEIKRLGELFAEQQQMIRRSEEIVIQGLESFLSCATWHRREPLATGMPTSPQNSEFMPLPDPAAPPNSLPSAQDQPLPTADS